MSVARRLSASSDAEIRNAVEGYASAHELVERAKVRFDAWWESLGHITRCEMDGFAAWKSFKAGYLSLARDLGRLPENGGLTP